MAFVEMLQTRVICPLKLDFLCAILFNINQLKQKTMKIKILSLAIAGILLASFSFTPMSNAKTIPVNNKVLCPLVTLSSPPSTLRVLPCGVDNVLTVSTNTCSPYTFYFTWSGGSSTQSTASGSNVLTFKLPSMPVGTVISLTITDCCGGSSGIYTFTATGRC